MTEVYHRVVDCRDMEDSGTVNSLTGAQTVKEYGGSSPKLTLYVQVKLELGHHANLRLKPTFEGYTHDWEVFIRSPEGAVNNALHHFIKRVEFHLHQSFSRQKIVQKEPPFRFNESGYAGFLLPIDVYLRNPGHPKKIRFFYDLSLDQKRSTSHIRCEKITFRNPPSGFRNLLFKGGGQLIRRRTRLLNDTGFSSFSRSLSLSLSLASSSSFNRSLDRKPSMTSSFDFLSRDLTTTATAADNKDWFKVKQEQQDKYLDYGDKENIPEGVRRNQPNPNSKSSISFLQDWLRNIRQTKSSNNLSVSSSGVSSSESSPFLDHGQILKTVTKKARGDRFKEERRLLREMMGASKIKQTVNSVNSVDNTVKSQAVKRPRGRPRKNPEVQSSSKRSPSTNSRPILVPKKFVPSSNTEVRPDATSNYHQKFKTNSEILNSITRRRFLKVNDHKPGPLVGSSSSSSSSQPHSLDRHEPERLSETQGRDNGSGISSNWSAMTSPVRIQRRGRGRPRKNPTAEGQTWQASVRQGSKKSGLKGPTTRARFSDKTQERPVPAFQHHPESNFQEDSGSDDEDVIITGYCPPKKQRRHRVPPSEIPSGGQSKKTSRNRSTQLQLLRTASNEFSRSSESKNFHKPLDLPKKISKDNDGTAFGLAQQAQQQETRPDLAQNCKNKPKLLAIRYDSEDEQSTCSSDMSTEYPSDIYRSPTFPPSAKIYHKNSTASDTIQRQSKRRWMTSTPVKHRFSTTRGPAAHSKRRKKLSNEDRAWSQSTGNRKLKQSSKTKQFSRKRSVMTDEQPCFYPDPVGSVTQLPGTSEEVTVSGEPVTVLVELQQSLATLTDPVLLRKVVEIVEESGKYGLDDAMFDFDLCNLDRNTVTRLKECLLQTPSML